MAHVGSALTIASNCRCASEYQKSCSSATPRLNGACVDGKQETGNETSPSFSERASEGMGWSIDIWATAGNAVRVSRDNASIFIAINYRTGGYLLNYDFRSIRSRVSRLRHLLRLVA